MNTILAGDVVKVKDELTLVDSSINGVNNKTVATVSGKVNIDSDIVYIQSNAYPTYQPVNNHFIIG